MPAKKGGKIWVAQIGAPQGIRGEVRLWSFTADPVAVKGYGRLEGEDGRRFKIEALRPGKGFLVARFKGISDRNAAERLNNLKLYVSRGRLPPTENDEFYHADLIGLTAATAEGAVCGTIAAVHNFGAGDLLEVKPANGPTVLLPFTDGVVPVVDLAAGRLVINPPEGAFSGITPLKEGSRRNRRAGVDSASVKGTPSRSRTGRSTSRFRGKD